MEFLGREKLKRSMRIREEISRVRGSRAVFGNPKRGNNSWSNKSACCYVKKEATSFSSLFLENPGAVTNWTTFKKTHQREGLFSTALQTIFRGSKHRSAVFNVVHPPSPLHLF